jgi:hypothetical protein
MPITTSLSIDDAVKTFVAESRYTMQERPGVVWGSISKETLPEKNGPTVTVPKFGQVNTYGLTQGVDMAQAQEITDSGISITPAEYGAQVILTDYLMMTAKDDFFRVAGRLLGESFDRQREQTLCDDFDNFSVTAGGAATAMNIGHVMAMNYSLKYNAPANGSAGRGGEPAPGRILGFITPATAHSLRKTMAGGIGAAAATQFTPDLSKAPAGQEFMADEVMIKTTINLNKDTSDDVKCGFLSPEAIIGVQLGSGPSAEKERDASLRAYEVNFTGYWGRAEYNDAWGREFVADSALPTS